MTKRVLAACAAVMVSIFGFLMDANAAQAQPTTPAPQEVTHG